MSSNLIWLDDTLPVTVSKVLYNYNKQWFYCNIRISDNVFCMMWQLCSKDGFEWPHIWSFLGGKWRPGFQLMYPWRLGHQTDMLKQVRNCPCLNDQETHSIFTQFHLSLWLSSSNDLKENYILMFLLARTVNPNHTGNSMLLIMKVTLKVPMP